MAEALDPTLETRLRRRERRRSFSIFFSIAFAIYALINCYIFVHLSPIVPKSFGPLFLPIFVAVALTFIFGEVLEHRRSTAYGRVITWVGAFWLGAIAWLVPAFLILDVLRLILGLFSGIFQGTQGRATSQTVTDAIVVFTFAGMLAGFLNARKIRVKPLNIGVEKACPPLRIAAISDMHMGTLIGQGMVRQMVHKINALHPDLVLMIGDQVDGNPHPVMQLDLGSELKKIESRYGVFAITGNHEYIGNAETSCAYLEAHGITMLRDATAEVAGIQIVGREDVAAKQFANCDRKTLADLLVTVDKSKPLILMDHTPFHLEQAEQNGIDLQLSGHTHHAQIWPWSFITRMVYEVSWGYKRKGSTHIYVSCGAGTWGPPIRIGNTPEIMDIRLTGKI